jgi:uncharacterized protein
MKKFKQSYYNFFIEVPEYFTYLIYNSRMNSLIELPFEKGEYLKNNTNDDYDNYWTATEEELLLRNGVLIGKDIDETKLIYDLYSNIRNAIVNSDVLSLTIAPTMECNLACPYCYETSHKKNHHRITPEIYKRDLALFLEKQLECENKIKKVRITWFGGEPLIAYKLIDELSELFISTCDKYKVDYSSDIITNGTLLNEKISLNLIKWKVSNIQITLDGPMVIHDIKRPFKSKTGSSFKMIMKNISNIPINCPINIRINIDKEIIDNLPGMLAELSEAKIWPHRIPAITLTLGKKEYYAGVTQECKDIFLTQEEFSKIKNEWKAIQLNYYNDWTKINGKKPGKIKFEYPKYSEFICRGVNTINSLLIDDQGNIRKCWEDIENPDSIIQHISQTLNYENPKYKKWTDNDKYIITKECRECKYFPICDDNCTRKHFEGTYNCSSWKYNMTELLKAEYILLKSHPDLIGFSKSLKDKIQFQ